MELTFALILLVQVSFVISSPYGYGPRSATSAKADASAVAGVYGDAGTLPVNIPQGTGYSGSFSKSYSSSSASSGAISSASASSFSYSGSGSGGSPYGGETGCSGGCNGAKKSTGAFNDNSAATLPGQGIGTGQYNNGGTHNEPKTSDCGSGNCQPASGKSTGSYGSAGTPSAFNGANAFATAGAGQTESTYSQDKTSPNSKPDCQGSDCDSSSNKSECRTGKCGPNGNANAGTDAKCTSGNCATTSQDGKCKSGQCGSQFGSPSNEYGSNDIKVSTNSGNQPASSPSYTPEYPPCSSPDCNNYGQGPPSTPINQGYNKPSINLTTPKQSQTKSNPTTNIGITGQNTFTSPSTPCVGSHCNQALTQGPYSMQFATKSLSPNGPTSCASGNCNSYPSTQSPGGYGGSLNDKPFSAYGSTAPQSTFPVSGPLCSPGSPNCNAGIASTGPASSCTPGHGPCNDAFAPGQSCAPDSPNCKAGIAPKGPASSCASGPGPCNDAFPSGPYLSTGSVPSSPGYQPGQTGTGTSGFPSSYSGISTPIYNTPKPGANVHLTPVATSPNSEKLPSYNDGFSGPAGILKPNEFKAPSSPYAPATAANTPSTINPAACATGNCSPQSHASPSYESSSGSHTAPAAGSNIVFGGPSGILKPNEFTAPSSAYSKPATIGASETKPACNTGYCGLPGASPSYSTGGSRAPAIASASASANVVAYTGGFGGPPGVLKPNDGGKGDLQQGKPQVSHQRPYSNNGVGSQQASNSNNGLGSHQGSYSNNGVGSQQGLNSNNGLGSHQGSYSNNGVGSQQGSNSNNGLGSHQGSYSNNGVGSQQGSNSNNGLGSHQGSYSNNGVGSQQGSNSNNGLGPHQGSYSNNGLGSHQGSFPNNGLGSPQGSYSNNGLGSQAQANAVASANAGAYGGSNGAYGSKLDGGCGIGCGGGGSFGSAPTGGSYGAAPSGGSYGGGSYSGNRGGAKYDSGLGGLQATGATAKSLAGTSGYGGSYASSSASATSGAATKGSYGK